MERHRCPRLEAFIPALGASAVEKGLSWPFLCRAWRAPTSWVVSFPHPCGPLEREAGEALVPEFVQSASL